MRVEIVEEWHAWDGFISGIVRIDGSLYIADSPTDPMEDDRRYRARSLFHLVNPLLAFHGPSGMWADDPGVIEFTGHDLVREAVKAPPG